MMFRECTASRTEEFLRMCPSNFEKGPSHSRRRRWLAISASLFLSARYANTIAAPLSRPFSRRPSLLAFSYTRSSLLPILSLLIPLLTYRLSSHVGTVFPRLSTRHLFAGAIWKFNACALAMEDHHYSGPPTAVVWNYLSRFPTSPYTHSRTYTYAFAHPHTRPAFPRTSPGNSDRTLSSHLSLVSPAYTRIRM